MPDVMDDFKVTHPRWARLIDAGVDPEEVDVRRYGDACLLDATAHLQNAVEAVATHFSQLLEADGRDEYREVLTTAQSARIFPVYREALAEWEKQLGNAMRFVADRPEIPEALEALDNAEAA